jgi:ATP-dependent protease ClpP protease subunit
MQPYAFATGEDGVAEIELYGDIVRRRPVDWWTGEPMEGSFIILSEFLAGLKKIETSPKIRIRIHSTGGHAYDALTIHNRLKELSGKGTEIEVIVDGVAMSGGSLIMCAGKTVKVFPGSLIMIHSCWVFMFGGYSAKELRKEAECNEAVDRSQAAVYHVKTGLTQDELVLMMEQETYMTGQEAIDKGFADELVEGTALEIAASADRRTLYVGGMPVWESGLEGGIPPHVILPVFQPQELESAPAAAIDINQPAKAGGTEGGKTMAKNLEGLRAENPELANQLMTEARAAASLETGKNEAAAVEAERNRIKEIDAVAALFDDETVREAKYGENPCTAQEMTYRAAQKASQEGKNFMSDLRADGESSGAKNIEAAPGGDDSGSNAQTPEAKMEKARADVRGLLGKKAKED